MTVNGRAVPFSGEELMIRRLSREQSIFENASSSTPWPIAGGLASAPIYEGGAPRVRMTSE